MTDTKIAPRRLPFPIGTKMVFAQIAVPPDWSLDTSDDDRLFRVVSGGSGGSVGGPDNFVTSNNDVTLSHNHGLASHVHDMSAHDHTYTHSHSGPSITGNVSLTATENSANYRVHDDTPDAWYFRVGGSRHIAVNADSANEGEHDHSMFQPNSAAAITQGSNTTNTGGPSVASSAIDSGHNHAVDSAWRPRYLDVVVGSLVG